MGQTLSHFRITAKLGEGGMGEVYRAEDTKLGREVAIKMLPEAVASDPERLARFEREAKVLASLNHPHIAAIYSLESATVAEGDEPGVRRARQPPRPERGEHPAEPTQQVVTFLVMELVGGEDLQQRLERGPIPVDEALPLALQIAEALEVAHEAGIVHRDLKPANIKATPEGEVKILDFGLAKVWQETDGERPDLTRSPTLTAPMTQAGVILGTAAYMSPEQARGQPVDRRADIWSFGVIVHEMLTGRSLFGGSKTVTDALAAILRADIDFDALPEGTPVLLRRLLERCLERDPRQRLHDIGDARLDLQEIASGIDPFAVTAADQAPDGRRSSLLWTGVAAIVALLIGLALGRQVAPTKESAARAPLHVSLALPEGTRLAGWASIVALSPDGLKAAYAAEGPDGRHLYVHRLDRGEIIRIEGSHGAEAPFFSPDSEWVGFGAGSISGSSPLPPELRKASLATGIAQTITPVLDYFGGAWDPDGNIYYVDEISRGIQRVDSAGGTPEPLVGGSSPEDERPAVSVLWPELLPDGRSLLAIAYQGLAGGSVVHVDRETGATRDLGIAAMLVRYTGTGHLVYVTREGDLYATAFDPDRGAVRGSPVALLRDLARGFAPVMAVSPGGALLYAHGYLQGSGRELSRLVAVDATGQTTELGYEPAPYVRAFALSPDERQLAVGTSDGSLWRYDLGRGTRSKLPAGTLAQQAQPVWSPDGELLAIHGSGPGNQWGFDMFMQPADGTGEPAPLVIEQGEQWPLSFVPGTRTLIYARWAGNWPWGALWAVDLDDPASRRELLRQDKVDLLQGIVSPDGRWIAYVTAAEGEREVWLRTYPRLESPRQVSVGGGTGPRWAPGGNTLYYWGKSSSDLLMAIEVADDGSLSAARELSRLPAIQSSGQATSYAPLSDGTFLAILRDLDSGVVTRLHLVLDWTAELGRLLPAG